MKSKLSLLAVLALAAGTLSIGAHAAGTSTSSGSGSLDSSVGGSATGSLGAGADTGVNADLSLFQQLDANGDGIVDKKEANKSAQAKSEFKSIDANGDGKISAEEWAAHASKSKQ